MISNTTGKSRGKSVESRILGDVANLASPCNRGVQCIGSFLPALFDEFFERQRAVVFLVVSGINEGNLALSGLAPEDVHIILLVFQFAPVALLELLPPRRIMSKPLAQFRAGSNV